MEKTEEEINELIVTAISADLDTWPIYEGCLMRAWGELSVDERKIALKKIKQVGSLVSSVGKLPG